jgi:predicted nucleic acid-binding Zn ribbon protein
VTDDRRTNQREQRREERRGSPAPRPIAEVLAQLLTARGLDEDVARAQVLEAWPRAVGTQIAGVTQPRMISADGTLVVGVKTHAWMQELSLMERALVARINAAGGRHEVQRIRWELMR